MKYSKLKCNIKSGMKGIRRIGGKNSMNKPISILALIVTLAIGITGCGSNTKTSDNNTGTASTSTGRRSQHAGANLMGEVTSVNGNQITFKVAEMPNFTQGNRQQNGSQGNNTQGTTAQGNTAQGGNRTPGQNSSRPQQGGLKYTGESKTITVPDGVSITAAVRGNNGAERKTLETKDLKQGDILQIWYSDTDKQTVSRITVRSSSDSPANTNTANNTDSTSKTGTAGQK